MEPTKYKRVDWQKLKKELSGSSEKFIQTANGIPADKRTNILNDSEWTPKDILSHIVGWDVEVMNKFGEFLVNPDADDNYDIDAFNRVSVFNRKDKAWDKIMEEFLLTRQKLSVLVDDLTENNLNSDPRFVEWVKVLIDHYDHHRIQLTSQQK